jgi:D-alanyl-lipoteichoic acid acyltransferase DltB (MBOAT superfamily)
LSTWLRPPELFNPLLAPPDEPLTPAELLASPYGLFVFLPLVPLVRLIGRHNRRAALIVFPLLWQVATLGPKATAILIAGVGTGALWILGLAALRAWGRLSPRTTSWLTWLGLHALILPVWWYPTAPWYGWEPSRLPVLHNIGFAYFLLRFISWGRSLTQNPHQPLRLADTICWILYPPCQRLGPVLLRESFLERMDAWNPRARPDWAEVGRRLGGCVLGLVALGIIMANTPSVAADTPDFFAAPQGYSTDVLLRLFYLIPLQVYLLLWCYNELACGLASWVGIPVDYNFRWVPAATSIRELWRRWHVTVGRWARDHIYIPLGGNRGRVELHYLAVFGYLAFWHGPSPSFLAWGILQAAALSLQRRWELLRRTAATIDQPLRQAAGANPADCQPGRRTIKCLGSIVWTAICWLLTMHFAAATILIFVDFRHLGMRLLPELARRLAATAGLF